MSGMEFERWEATMSIHFISPASVEFTGRVAEWRRRTRSRNELMNLGDHVLRDLPFSNAQIRTEASKWFWQS